MEYEEFGKENQHTIVFLHGAFFVHTYGRQYPLAKKYRLLVPHIMGFGRNTSKDFHTEEAIEELHEFISSLGNKVLLVGFSLGAQLAYELVCRYQDLFTSAIIVSPWLIKSKDDMPEMIKMNLSQLKDLHNKTKCRLIALMNGLPKAARKEFVEEMQNVSEETVFHCVDNGIALSDSFKDVKIPIIALAGEKEQKDIIESVNSMARMNPYCKAEVWPRCAHNIPPLHAKDFNSLIEKMIQ